MKPIIHAPITTGEVQPVVNSTELAGIPKYRQRAIAEGEAIFEQALAETTGMSKAERRAAIDKVVDRFRERLVHVDGKAVTP